MYTTYNIPIIKFFQTCLPAARDNGYKYVMCLLARDRGNIDELYKTLEQEWYALDDITGKDFLFLFGGKQNIDDTHSAIAIDAFQVYNSYLHVMNIDPSLNTNMPDVFNNREKSGEFSKDLPKNHTRAISEIRNFFGLSDNDIPCFIFVNLHNGAKIVVPFNGNNIYDYFRCLFITIEKQLRELNRLIAKVDIYNKISTAMPNTLITARDELLKIAETITPDERTYLFGCMDTLTQNKNEVERRAALSREIRIKLGEYFGSVGGYHWRFIFNSNDIARVLMKSEPKNSMAKIDALYKEIDEIIHESSAFLSEHQQSPRATTIMHQSFGRAVHIGTIADGGTVNIVETKWNAIVVQRTFDMLEDLLLCLKDFRHGMYMHRSPHGLNSRLSAIEDFYGRHQSDLDFIAPQVKALKDTSAKYNKTLWEYDFYSAKDMNRDASPILSECIDNYNNLANDMIQRIRAEGE